MAISVKAKVGAGLVGAGGAGGGIYYSTSGSSGGTVPTKGLENPTVKSMFEDSQIKTNTHASDKSFIRPGACFKKLWKDVDVIHKKSNPWTGSSSARGCVSADVSFTEDGRMVLGHFELAAIDPDKEQESKKGVGSVVGIFISPHWEKPNHLNISRWIMHLKKQHDVEGQRNKDKWIQEKGYVFDYEIDTSQHQKMIVSRNWFKSSQEDLTVDLKNLCTWKEGDQSCNKVTEDKDVKWQRQVESFDWDKGQVSFSDAKNQSSEYQFMPDVLSMTFGTDDSTSTLKTFMGFKDGTFEQWVKDTQEDNGYSWEYDDDSSGWSNVNPQRKNYLSIMAALQDIFVRPNPSHKP